MYVLSRAHDGKADVNPIVDQVVFPGIVLVDVNACMAVPDRRAT